MKFSVAYQSKSREILKLTMERKNKHLIRQVKIKLSKCLQWKNLWIKIKVLGTSTKKSKKEQKSKLKKKWIIWFKNRIQICWSYYRMSKQQRMIDNKSSRKQVMMRKNDWRNSLEWKEQKLKLESKNYQSNFMIYF